MSDSDPSIANLEAALNHFDLDVRARTLQTLADRTDIPFPPESNVANMHCHSFFSFNAYGHSPMSLAWLARRSSFRLVGIVDFDVLDGVDEFLDACDRAGVRGTAGIETRVMIPEYSAVEINSPGEPGVAYHMGIGFSTGHVPRAVAGILADLGRRAGARNQEIVARVNAYLDPIAVDYQRDVVSLTPSGNPTERHIVMAYIQAAERAMASTAAFWADKLRTTPADVAALPPHSPEFQNLLRARLMKQGSVGYVQPEPGMFPTIEELHTLIVACGALPCAAWLDGTSAAEQDLEAWLGLMVGKGVLALNIIPNRNWDVPDPAMRDIKVRNLYRVVDVAREMDLPLNVGTEMNSFGQKPVDEFDAPELAPVRQPFLDGAHVVYGHTVMQRALGLGYLSDWAQACLPGRRERNAFYLQVGAQVPPGRATLARLKALGSAASPADVLARLERAFS